MQERDRAIKRADTHAETIETLVNEKAQAEALAATLQGELNKALAQIAELEQYQHDPRIQIIPIDPRWDGD